MPLLCSLRYSFRETRASTLRPVRGCLSPRDLCFMNLFRHFASLPALAACAAVVLLSSCEDKEKDDAKKPKTAAASKDKEKGKTSKKAHHVDDDPVETSQSIEALTGGSHARLVWVKCAKPHTADAFAQSEGLVLMGVDTRDGKGERAILSKPANYSRPLLSTDGKTVLYTDKNTTRKGSKKHYAPVVYRTDWQGSKPVRLAEGYAVDCWKDPASGIEWVFAVVNFKATKGLSLEGEKLIRFPLDDPSKVETVYDDTPVTPDNIQFSRDGTRASGQFPWPNSGVLALEGGRYVAKKFTIGCWTSMSPDNSGVSWTFDGEHRQVAMAADDGAKTWNINLSEAAGMRGAELYHPRWTNHPRYIVVTGPYTKQKGVDGSVINKGGGTAQVYLGRLSETADKVEAWLQVSHDKNGEAYPDAWIAGADKASLKGHAIPAAPVVAVHAPATAWPRSREGLLFLWKDRTSLNTFATRDGAKHESHLSSQGAARNGRLGQLLLDGGAYEADAEATAAALAHLSGAAPASFEAIVLPPSFEGTAPPTSAATIFSAPAFVVAQEQDRLLLKNSTQAWKSRDALPPAPFHLAVVRGAEGFELHVNGEPMELEAATFDAPAHPAAALTFGGGWNGGLLNIALYDRALTAEDAAASAQAAQARIAAFPAAPPRVQVRAKLTEVSAMPTAEGIAPYTSSLIVYVYEVEQVIEGALAAKNILVKHWAMLGEKVVQGFPREAGKSYELLLEREADHSHLKGERVMDDSTSFDLETWFDVASPRVVP